LALDLANEIHETPLLLDVLLEIAGLWVSHRRDRRARDVLLCLLQQPQLPRQRHQRVKDLLARLGVDGDRSTTNHQDSLESLEQIVILASAVDLQPA
jgi:hypothetical protein